MPQQLTAAGDPVRVYRHAIFTGHFNAEITIRQSGDRHTIILTGGDDAADVLGLLAKLEEGLKELKQLVTACA